MIHRADIVWVDYGEPVGSRVGKLRPAIVLQEDWSLASKICTVVTVPLTTNLRRSKAPGNVLIPSAASGLDHDSVAIVSQVMSVDRDVVDPYPVANLPGFLMKQVDAGVRLVTGV